MSAVAWLFSWSKRNLDRNGPRTGTAGGNVLARAPE